MAHGTEREPSTHVSPLKVLIIISRVTRAKCHKRQEDKEEEEEDVP